MITLLKFKQRRCLTRALAFFSLFTFSLSCFAAPITLGAKNFTEQHVLSAITVQYLNAKGFDIRPKTDLSTVIIREAMMSNQVDICWEYTGTSLIIFNHIEERMSAEDAYNTVKRLDGEKGLVWLNPANMNNTYAFAMKHETAEKYNIKTISDLADRLNAMKRISPKNNWMVAFDVEFVNRSDGLKPLQAFYQFELQRYQIRQMDSGLAYNAVRDGFVEVGLVFTTDGRIRGFDLYVLEDDKDYFPSYAVTPVVRKPVLDSTPGLAEALNTLSATLDNDIILDLNAKVDIEHRSVDSVAREFLQEKGLL